MPDEQWTFQLKTQPAQSPDLNMLDLSFFSALKHDLAHVRYANNVNQLIQNVKAAYQNYDPVSINNQWGHLYDVYRTVLQSFGTNQYKVPHGGLDEG
jgi:hypothetical protein